MIQASEPIHAKKKKDLIVKNKEKETCHIIDVTVQVCYKINWWK